MKSVLKVWAALLVVKLVLGSLIPLFHDETYYLVWANHLDWGYFDHPGFIAWLMYVGKALSGSFLSERWPIVVLGHLTVLVWLYILKPVLTKSQLLFFLLLVCVTPLTGPGSLIVNPDIPLMFFWSLSLFSFIKFVAIPNIFWSALMGLFLGLGFTSKYQIVLFTPCALIYLWKSKKWRLIKPQFLLASLVTFFIGALPTLYWNYEHDFVSFRFQLNHGLGAETFNPEWPLVYILSQALLLFPPLLYLAFKNRKKSDFFSLLYPFAFFPLAFFLFTSFKGRVEANWAIAAHPAVLALAAGADGASKMIKRALGVWTVLLLVVVFLLLFPIKMVNETSKKFGEPHEFDKIVKVANAYKPLYARSFQMASQLTYQLGYPVYKLRGMNRKDFYDFLPESLPNSKHFFVVVEHREPLSDQFRRKSTKIVSRHMIDFHFEIVEVQRP